MLTGQPSRTARGAALRRAAHQILDGGRVFADPFAVLILGLTPEDVLHEERADPPNIRRGFRLSLAARSRFAENRLAVAIRQRGVAQYVILGAGLDTFAYRNPHGAALRVFEVDHPDTQAWKRRRLEDAGIDVPTWLTFVPVDFERDDLSRALGDAGFSAERRSFMSWLGVVPYLTRGQILATLEAIARLPGGSEVVLDFAEPPEAMSPRARQAYERRAAKVAGFGEPWISTFVAVDLADQLQRLGFTGILDLGPREIARRFYPAVADRVPERGGHLMHAWKDRAG